MDGSVEKNLRLVVSNGGKVLSAGLEDDGQINVPVKAMQEDTGQEDTEYYQRVSCHVSGLTVVLLNAGHSV